MYVCNREKKRSWAEDLKKAHFRPTFPIIVIHVCLLINSKAWNVLSFFAKQKVATFFICHLQTEVFIKLSSSPQLRTSFAFVDDETQDNILVIAKKVANRGPQERSLIIPFSYNCYSLLTQKLEMFCHFCKIKVATFFICRLHRRKCLLNCPPATVRTLCLCWLWNTRQDYVILAKSEQGIISRKLADCPLFLSMSWWNQTTIRFINRKAAIALQYKLNIKLIAAVWLLIWGNSQARPDC